MKYLSRSCSGVSDAPYRRPRAVLACLALAATLPASADNLVAYDFAIRLQPASSELAVDAVIDLPASFAGQTVEFLLASNLRVESSAPRVAPVRGRGAAGFQGINGSSVELTREDGTSRYRVTFPDGAARLEITWRGPVNFPLAMQGEEYARGFEQTPGLIDERGVYLAGSSLWYPFFGDDLVTFRLAAAVPDGWQLISQGNGSAGGEDGLARWDSAGPVDEIYLVGGPLIRYAQSAGAVSAEVYLHDQDDALAAKYLDATTRYIEMYSRLIGPYPYGKFALVENFWETGYGMPSFTLLGPQIIRFPFILTSSYPHEILHNWWGNSVFVDYRTGNWAEGLTAYLADHLMKERQGQGAEYRRDTLKKYRDFVSDGRDFPLTAFRSRHSAATEAVGYGKTMMGLHMIRLRIGDDAFREALANFYRDFRGRRAGFTDLEHAFEASSGQDLGRFFREWTTRAGAADLTIENVMVSEGTTGWRVTGTLVQSQSTGPLELDVPLVFTTRGAPRIETLRVNAARSDFEYAFDDRPLLLAVDPEFDLFRLLDARETAPSIGQVFGESAALAVLPAEADEETRQAYRTLAENWSSPIHRVEIVTDAELDALPADRGIWLFGRENRFAGPLLDNDGPAAVRFDGETITIAGDDVPFDGHSSVIVVRNPSNVAKAIAWITADPLAAATGIGSKLPHYGKYSWLVFEGEEPANIMKGEWPASDSPLRLDLRDPDARDEAVVPAQMPARVPLADLPPVFSAERLAAHVNYLASPDLAGRGLGSAELEQAADYIAAEFAAAGLEPGGDDGGYFQVFTVDTGPDGGPHRVRNVIGYVPGTNPGYDGQAAVLSAHYDHLGLGWPDERAAAEPGSVYPGADDNASGVAVLIELARAFAATPQERTLVFVAFTAEEAGLLGSKYFVKHATPVPAAGIIGVINLDTVGRLGDNPVYVLATDSASDWPHIFRGVSFVTGIATENIPGASDSSDQQSFIDAGIPGVQIFSGANFDYHRPSDTPDKIDPAGMIRVATVVREAALHLGERDTALAATAPEAADRARRQPGERRVSFGILPDFAYPGPGVRAESVVPGSSAETAGIVAGDIVTAIDGNPIADLRGFSEALTQYAPGDTVQAMILRDDETFGAAVELTAR